MRGSGARWVCVGSNGTGAAAVEGPWAAPWAASRRELLCQPYPDLSTQEPRQRTDGQPCKPEPPHAEVAGRPHRLRDCARIEDSFSAVATTDPELALRDPPPACLVNGAVGVVVVVAVEGVVGQRPKPPKAEAAEVVAVSLSLRIRVVLWLSTNLRIESRVVVSVSLSLRIRVILWLFTNLRIVSRFGPARVRQWRPPETSPAQFTRYVRDIGR